MEQEPLILLISAQHDSYYNELIPTLVSIGYVCARVSNSNQSTFHLTLMDMYRKFVHTYTKSYKLAVVGVPSSWVPNYYGHEGLGMSVMLCKSGVVTVSSNCRYTLDVSEREQTIIAKLKAIERYHLHRLVQVNSMSYYSLR